MATYILRDIPPHIWQPFADRAKQEGWPLRPLLYQLMSDYATGLVGPTKPAPAPPPGLPRFALRPVASIGHGASMENARVCQYEVTGLPHPWRALIADYDGGWHTLLIDENVGSRQSDWTREAHVSAEAALEDLLDRIFHRML